MFVCGASLHIGGAIEFGGRGRLIMGGGSKARSMSGIAQFARYAWFGFLAVWKARDTLYAGCVLREGKIYPHRDLSGLVLWGGEFKMVSAVRKGFRNC